MQEEMVTMVKQDTEKAGDLARDAVRLPIRRKKGASCSPPKESQGACKTWWWGVGVEGVSRTES